MMEDKEKKQTLRNDSGNHNTQLYYGGAAMAKVGIGRIQMCKGSMPSTLHSRIHSETEAKNDHVVAYSKV